MLARLEHAMYCNNSPPPAWQHAGLLKGTAQCWQLQTQQQPHARADMAAGAANQPVLSGCGCRCSRKPMRNSCPSLIVAPLATIGIARHLRHMLHGLAFCSSKAACRHWCKQACCFKPGKGWTFLFDAECSHVQEALCPVHAAHKVFYAGCSQVRGAN